MNTKRILWIASVVVIVATTWVALIYKNEIAEQYGLKQLAELETGISVLNVDIKENNADIVAKEEELKSLRQIAATLSWELYTKEAKYKEIKTAIFYLNKALWTETK